MKFFTLIFVVQTLLVMPNVFAMEQKDTKNYLSLLPEELLLEIVLYAYINDKHENEKKSLKFKALHIKNFIHYSLYHKDLETKGWRINRIMDKKAKLLRGVTLGAKPGEEKRCFMLETLFDSEVIDLKNPPPDTKTFINNYFRQKGICKNLIQ